MNATRTIDPVGLANELRAMSAEDLGKIERLTRAAITKACEGDRAGKPPSADARVLLMGLDVICRERDRRVQRAVRKVRRVVRRQFNDSIVATIAREASR